MKSITLKIIAAVVGLSLVGCADLARKFATSDGLIDFILAVSGYEQIDAYPTERISRGEGEIITAHARKDSRGAIIFGDVGKQFGAPLGSPRRRHMLMLLCWIPKADISRTLRLDSFLRRCQRPNAE
jgi:hypothetical protein